MHAEMLTPLRTVMQGEELTVPMLDCVVGLRWRRSGMSVGGLP